MIAISTRKQSAAFALACIPDMPQTRRHIWANVTAAVPASALSSMTARQIGAVIAAAHRSYCDGRARNDAEVVDDAVWIGAGVDRLIPLAALKTVTTARTDSVTHYRMDYTEGV